MMTKTIFNPTDINFRDKDSRTRLMRASYMGNKDLVAVLLNGKAVVDLKDKNGHTASDLAVIGGHNEIVALLKVAEETKR